MEVQHFLMPLCLAITFYRKSVAKCFTCIPPTALKSQSFQASAFLSFWQKRQHQRSQNQVLRRGGLNKHTINGYYVTPRLRTIICESHRPFIIKISMLHHNLKAKGFFSEDV